MRETGIPTNPLRALRLAQGWSQAELAEFAGITRHAVLRTEQGVYSLPPPAILSVFSQRIPGSSIPYLEKAYTEWQTKKRRCAGILFPDAPLVALSATSSEFLNWRTFSLGMTSRMEFCRVFCVHPAVVEKYEKRKQFHMPDQLATALKEAGLLL